MRKIRSGDTCWSSRDEIRDNRARSEKTSSTATESSSRASTLSRSTSSAGGLDRLASSKWKPHCMFPMSCSFARAASSPRRVGVRTGDEGKNVRYCKKCENAIPRPEAA